MKNMNIKGIIELEGMRFRAFHGCFEQERREGNDFVVDFRAEVDAGRAAESDCLEDTLNYGDVYDIVAAEMAVPSNLLENVAGRIVQRIAGRFPELERFSVSVTKANPPVSGPADCARVTLMYDRAEAEE